MGTAHGTSLSRRAEALLRRRGVFIWVTIATLLAAGAFVLGLPNIYRASATLLVEGQLPDTVVPSAVPSGIDGRLLTIKQEAISRSRLTALLSQFDLYGVSQGRTSMDRALERLQRDIRVEPTSTDQSARGGAQTLAFRVSYVSSQPATASDVANALASFFVAQNDRMRAEQASRATEFLSAQLDETRRRLDEQEGRVRSFSTKNLGALPQQTEANIAAINRLDGQMRLNDAEQLRLIERRQTLQNDLATLDSQGPSETDPTPDAQVARLEHDLNDLRMRFGDSYPDVKATRAKLETLQREAAASAARAQAPASERTSQRTVLERALGEVDTQIRRLTAEDTAIKEQIAGYENRVESAPARAPEFEGLMRDYQATRDQYDALQKRFGEAQLAERAEHGHDTQEFRVLDVAVPPAAAAGPSRAMLLGLGALAAVLCGLCAVFLVDRFDSSFHSVDELRAFTRVPVLASIPTIATPPRLFDRVRVCVLASAGILAIGVLAGGAFFVARTSDQVARLLSRVM